MHHVILIRAGRHLTFIQKINQKINEDQQEYKIAYNLNSITSKIAAIARYNLLLNNLIPKLSLKARGGEGGKHQIFSFDIYERAPEDGQVEKNRM